MSTKRKLPTTLAKPVVRQSAKPVTKTRIDEARTSVADGVRSLASHPSADSIEISSDSNSDYDVSDGEEGSDDDVEVQNGVPDDSAKAITSSNKQSGVAVRSIPKQDGDDDIEMEETSPKDDAEPTSPTFGDLVRETALIDVSASIAAQQVNPNNLPASQNAIVTANSSSLGNVLNQALRSDDSDLLESCLQVNDLTIIQNTVNRMDSAHASILLSKLAARLHRRPGRAFGLMKWIQWTLVAHGGALATQQGLLRQLNELNKVLEERSRGLNSLLALKGKLDLLDAQMKLRKANRAAGTSRSRQLLDEGDEEEEQDGDDEGVIYVEGEEDNASERANGSMAAKAGYEDDFPAMNGIEDSDEESDSDDDGDNLIDDMAEESSMDEDEVDHDDVEESGEEDESDAEVAKPPSKVQKVASAFGKRR